MAKVIFKESEVRNVELVKEHSIQWLNLVFGGGEVEVIKDL